MKFPDILKAGGFSEILSSTLNCVLIKQRPIKNNIRPLHGPISWNLSSTGAMTVSDGNPAKLFPSSSKLIANSIVPSRLHYFNNSRLNTGNISILHLSIHLT